MIDVSLLVGRFQPCMHKGHVSILKQMKYHPFICIVNGEGTSKNKGKNPLTVDERIRLIVKCLGEEDLDFAITDYLTGYIPDIVQHLYQMGYRVRDLHAGPDRLADYKKKVDRANLSLNTSDKICLEYIEAKRITSSTDVRAAIRGDDFETFKSLMPKSMWNSFGYLREKLNNDKEN